MSLHYWLSVASPRSGELVGKLELWRKCGHCCDWLLIFSCNLLFSFDMHTPLMHRWFFLFQWEVKSWHMICRPHSFPRLPPPPFPLYSVLNEGSNHVNILWLRYPPGEWFNCFIFRLLGRWSVSVAIYNIHGNICLPVRIFVLVPSRQTKEYVQRDNRSPESKRS